MAHEHEISSKKLVIAILLNFLITLVEVIGGLMANSLSLLSDSLHNLSDAVAVLVSLIAIKLSGKELTLKMTFGYKRSEILAALLNALVLIIISFFLFREAIGRFRNPEEINSLLMITVGLIGLLANVAAVFLLHKESHENLNIKSAYLHLLSDSLSSVAVVIGGVCIYFLKIYWIDPIITIMIGLYVLKGCYSILNEAIAILMQSVPEGIDLEVIEAELLKFPEITNLHHVHVWKLNDRDIFFEGHIEMSEEVAFTDVNEVRKKVESILSDKFGITHVTLQVECKCCEEQGLLSCSTCSRCA
jgi:cobalt-zinc-cadmium efflux system protein